MNEKLKTECDGNCDTCPSEFKIHCAVTFSKRNNEMLRNLTQRMGDIESKLQSTGNAFLTPQGFGETSSPQTSKQVEEE